MRRKILLKLNTTDTPDCIAQSVSEFNEWVNKYPADNEIILTKGGNISQENLRHTPCCKTWKRNNRFEFHFIDAVNHVRVIYAPRDGEDIEVNDPMRALHAKTYFAGLLDVIPKDDVEPETELFTCPENQNSKYYNYINNRFMDVTLHNCFSLDRNSAFLASMVDEYPQAKPWVDKFQADKLKIKAIPKNERTAEQKELLQYDKIIVGWLNNASTHRHNAWVKIISNSNRKIHELRKYVESLGHVVLLVNTDAVKFIGEVPFEASKDLGGFKYEWFDTEMYIKGVKSYAYKDGDKWKYKQAGLCRLDKIKPNRDEWTLDDFKAASTVEIIKIRKQKNSNLLEEYYG